MDNKADIRDTNQLDKLRKSLLVFQSVSNDTLKSIDRYLNETKAYFKQSEQTIKQSVEAAKRDYQNAKAELDYCRSQTYYDEDGYERRPDCSTERYAVNKAQGELRKRENRLRKFKDVIYKASQRINHYRTVEPVFKQLANKHTEIATRQLVEIIKGVLDFEATSIKTGHTNTSSGGNVVSDTNSILNGYDISTFRNWQNLGELEREISVKHFANFIADKLQVDISQVAFEDMSPNSRGYHQDGKIAINSDVLSNPENLKDGLDTVIHEIRHGFQHAAVDNPKKYGISENQARIWRKNFRNYISPQFDREGYFNQPVEVDARNFAEEVIKNINI